MKLQFGWPLCFLAVSAATTTYSSVWHDFSYTLLWMHQIVSATFKLNCCGNWWFQFQSLRNPIWASLLSFCAPDRSLQQSHRRPTPGQEFQIVPGRPIACYTHRADMQNQRLVQFGAAKIKVTEIPWEATYIFNLCSTFVHVMSTRGYSKSRIYITNIY